MEKEGRNEADRLDLRAGPAAAVGSGAFGSIMGGAAAICATGGGASGGGAPLAAALLGMAKVGGCGRGGRIICPVCATGGGMSGKVGG